MFARPSTGPARSSAARLAAGALAGLLFLPSSAWALDVHAWGVGPHLGTQFLPGAYPSGFPKRVARQDFDGDGEADDLDGDGEGDRTALAKVKGDLELGADAYLWIDDHHRLGFLPGLDLGKRYTDMRLLLAYDHLFDAGQLDPFVGGAVGAGTMTWRTEGEERLTVPYYPFRASVGLAVPDGLLGYQARLFGQWNLPSSHKYTASDGSTPKTGPGLYLAMGIELTVLFGGMDL